MNERDLSGEEANKRLTELYLELDMHPTIIEQPGGLVSTCSIYDSAATEISSGAGKGRDCHLGAMAECLEHYFTTTKKPRPFTTERILNAIEPFDDWLIKSIPEGCEIPAFQLEALNTTDTIIVPAILLAPSAENADDIEKTPASFLLKYSSNSGVALGCTEHEALLHALNEAIERHALSVYYMALCGLAQAPELYRPADSFLTETFGDNELLLETARNMDIYMSNNFFDVPFCIAMPRTPCEHTLSAIGSGCSVNPAIALSRAVTELIQCEQLRGAQEEQEDRAVYQALSDCSRLAPLRHPKLSYEPPLFHPLFSEQSVRAQIKHISLALHRQHKSAFFHTLYERPGYATVLQVYIPGLERFHLIRSGIPVVPQSAFHKGIKQRHAH